jgi:hypothetical protein
MHLLQNAETMDRLVTQGAILLKSFHAEYKKDSVGRKTEFLCGKIAGWRDTLHTLYHGSAEELIDRVLAKTGLAIPDGQGRSVGFVRLCREDFSQRDEKSMVA